jgi:hypothetical protein
LLRGISQPGRRWPPCGAEIDHVYINGVAINWPAMPACERPRSEVMADIAIGLGGVVAVERHRFGWPPAEDTVAAWNFDENQAADFSEATSLALAIDPTGADDVLFLAWCEALNFALEHWREIKTVAMLYPAQSQAHGRRGRGHRRRTVLAQRV